jgi:hypothetical protein
MRTVGFAFMLGVAACCLCLAPTEESPAPRPPDGSWTGWGPWVGGVRLRARSPRRVLRGERLDPEFEFEFDRAAAPEGTTHFVTNEFGIRTWLVFKERGTGRVVKVKPHDDGMPHFATNADRHLLSGPPPEHLFAIYFLSTVWKPLAPGSYDGHFEFHDPADRRRTGTDQVDWQPPRVWTGVLATPPFEFTVEAAPRRGSSSGSPFVSRSAAIPDPTSSR